MKTYWILRTVYSAHITDREPTLTKAYIGPYWTRVEALKVLVHWAW